jgi:SepF-like predicted cell division protein (DUF552 family)
MAIRDFLSRIFKKEVEPEYIEIDLGPEPKKSKVQVRPFVLKKFEDIPEILNALREGYTIAVIDMRPLREKDIIELKRSISKLRKTAEALEGSITGFGENIVIVTPNFAEIYRPLRQPHPNSQMSGSIPGSLNLDSQKDFNHDTLM